MTDDTRTLEDVKRVIRSVHESAIPKEKIGFYNDWAEHYEQDVALLDYRAPAFASSCLAARFHGNREAAVVLDVACGTGLVAAQLRKLGFQHFVGVDGSDAMLEMAKRSGLYRDLRKCMLGEDPLPVEDGLYDVVMIVGALSVGHVPVTIIRELCQATKPGGYVCMTTRRNENNLEYKAVLDQELEEMEAQGLWGHVEVTEVEEWERAAKEGDTGYIPGSVYVCRKPL